MCNVWLRRRGFTILELLIAIGIIGLLLAITIPAVQSAREAARRTQCLSNVKQLALACVNYSSVHKYYPPSGGMDTASFQVRILPFVEQQPLWEKFDLNRPMSEQIPLARLRPAVMTCPSDPVVRPSSVHASYCGNGGWSVPVAGDPIASELSGVFGFIGLEPILGPPHITDGLSQTAIISEFRPGGGDSGRRVFSEEISFIPANHRPPELIAKDCLNATFPSMFLHGMYWTTGGIRTTIYDHILPPNSRSCNHAITARSTHLADGVNVAHCDASARFVTAQVDVGIWRSLGTRSGKEVVPAH